MKTIQTIVVVASLSMIAGSACAFDTDLTALITKDTVINSDFAKTALVALTQAGTTGIEDNLAAIVQIVDGNDNYIAIDQTNTGVNNMAVIVQDGSTTANAAVIVQIGAANHAFINQH